MLKKNLRNTKKGTENLRELVKEREREFDLQEAKSMRVYGYVCSLIWI